MSLLSINNPTENVKMRKGLRKVSEDLYRIAKKLKSYSEIVETIDECGKNAIDIY